MDEMRWDDAFGISSPGIKKKKKRNARGRAFGKVLSRASHLKRKKRKKKEGAGYSDAHTYRQTN